MGKALSPLPANWLRHISWRAILYVPLLQRSPRPQLQLLTITPSHMTCSRHIQPAQEGMEEMHTSPPGYSSDSTHSNQPFPRHQHDHSSDNLLPLYSSHLASLSAQHSADQHSSTFHSPPSPSPKNPQWPGLELQASGRTVLKLPYVQPSFQIPFCSRSSEPAPMCHLPNDSPLNYHPTMPTLPLAPTQMCYFPGATSLTCYSESCHE